MKIISVPIIGVFNLTMSSQINKALSQASTFPSPLGDYLI